MAVHVTSAHLPWTSSEVLLQHAQLKDITGMLDDCHYGNGVAAPDVAVEALGTVETERSTHPKPGLATHEEPTLHTSYTLTAVDLLLYSRHI